ncbi:MAG: ribonuclease [Anaerophaga sp.]|uniref:ribonuclease R n=1 Tax=Anaerophaga thermohalophila TaxID=177400 RepID=UPI000237C4FE|nr:ribonuclease R [Anaerophaga thermohalophila]MDI3521339.1 ribonuclease [Anaerophaga sp.]MDK2841496.1 ribonuclease [Anaerophaga sp.]
MPKKKKRNNELFKKSDLRSSVKNLFKNNPHKTYNYKQVSAALGITKKKTRLQIEVFLFELSEENFLKEVSTGRFKLLMAPGIYVEGIVDMTTRGTAYIVPDEGDEDIFVAQSNLGHALNGDRVKVLQYARKPRKQAEGEVVEIIERSRDHFVGTLEVSKGFAFLVADSRVMHHDIFIPPEHLKGGKNGQKAVVCITEWPGRAKNPIGKVVDILGNPGENNTEMHAILAEFNLPYKYPANVVAAAEKIKDKIPAAEIKKRRDFRKVTTFTIDPADAKDFDDALSLRKLKNGNWEVGIHIADVTHYVHPNTVIDKEAADRATSVYLVDRVVPMLPERLSNELCSLRPDEDKLCFSAVFELDNDARVLDSWVGRTIIRSDRRFTYEEAQTVIETGEGDLNSELKVLNDLAQKLRKERFSKGSIDFERVEVKFELDENGNPLSVFFKEAKEANKLIEEFMLLANRRVAEIIGQNELDGKNSAPGKNAKTFVYRIHDEPNPEKYETFSKFVRKLGFEAMPKGHETIGHSLNRLLDEVQGKKHQNIVETLAIRTMSKAVYSTHNIGHYGLGFKYYTHFTSPIRRYPDMMVHRLLQRYLDGGRSVSSEKYEELCDHSTKMEIRAADAERASVKYKQVEFLKDRVGEVFDGVISGVTEWGIYVELDENKCEGMVPIRDLDDDFYQFDEENYCLVGRHKNRKYQLGDSVRIKIARANLERRQLDFTPAP